MDTTDRTAAEKELSESRRKLLTLIGNLPGMAYRCKNTPDWPFEFISEGCLDITGYAPEDFYESESLWGSLIHPDDQQMVWDIVQVGVESNSPFVLEYRIVAKDGTEKWMWEKGMPVRGFSGELLALEGFITDITERVIAEKENRETYQLLNTVLKHAPLVIAVKDAETKRFVFWNRESERAYGIWAHEAIGKRAEDLFSPEFAASLNEQDPAVLAKPGHPFYFEEEIPTHNGVVHHRKFKLALPDESGKPRYLLIMAEDLTEKREAEELRIHLEQQLFQAQKMESLGNLTGGIAHDFNNMLSAIIGYADMALEETPPSSSIYHKLQYVLEAARKAEKVTANLLAFSRKQMMNFAVVDLNRLLLRSGALLKGMIEENIDFRVFTSDDELRVKVDQHLIENVIINLTVNARDAMPKGGSLTIGIRRAEPGDIPDERRAQIGRGRYAFISVSDTGCGIPSEKLDDIFEPFFTTKPSGKGTGLGLSTAYGIVRQHGGVIWAESTVGSGSMFKMLLPIVDEELTVRTEDRSFRSTVASGNALVVEDDELVRGLVCSVLDNAGMKVREAATVEAAKSIAAELGSELDLLVADIVMPRMSGTELYKELSESYPNLRALFISGYPDANIEPGLLHSGKADYLAKPFPLGTLVSKCADLLKARGK
jgi:PAS domain S-box-containing protein